MENTYFEQRNSNNVYWNLVANDTLAVSNISMINIGTYNPFTEELFGNIANIETSQEINSPLRMTFVQNETTQLYPEMAVNKLRFETIANTGEEAPISIILKSKTR